MGARRLQRGPCGWDRVALAILADDPWEADVSAKSRGFEDRRARQLGEVDRALPGLFGGFVAADSVQAVRAVEAGARGEPDAGTLFPNLVGGDSARIRVFLDFDRFQKPRLA